MLSLLIESGAEVNASDSDGQTPLHYAALCEHLSIAEALLAGGADARLLSKGERVLSSWVLTRGLAGPVDSQTHDGVVQVLRLLGLHSYIACAH